MKTLIICLILLSFISCDITITQYDDLNNYIGCQIVKIDSTFMGGAPHIIFYIKTEKGTYDKIYVNPDFAQFYNVNDTI